MRAWIIIVIFLLIISASRGVVTPLAGGYKTSISGSSDHKVSEIPGTPNSYSPPAINDRNIRNYRDPSHIITSPFEIPSGSGRRNTPTVGISNTGNITTITSSQTFEMTSEVDGNGSINEYKAVQDAAGVNTKETSSSDEGNIVLSSRLAAYRDLSNNLGTGFVVSRNRVLFVGKSYLDQEGYCNNEDLIQNRVQSDSIYKDTIYFGSSSGATSSDTYSPNAYNSSESQTSYSLTTKFVGAFDFSAHLRSETNIEENYAGQMAINTSLSSLRTYNATSFTEDFLPCADGILSSESTTTS
jgi:hypothetical protein